MQFTNNKNNGQCDVQWQEGNKLVSKGNDWLWTESFPAVLHTSKSFARLREVFLQNHTSCQKLRTDNANYANYLFVLQLLIAIPVWQLYKCSKPHAFYTVATPVKMLIFVRSYFATKKNKRKRNKWKPGVHVNHVKVAKIPEAVCTLLTFCIFRVSPRLFAQWQCQCDQPPNFKITSSVKQKQLWR